jgi:hypothetical protein
MKIFLAVLMMTIGFTAKADIGDFYTTPAKVGRIAVMQGLYELTAVMVQDPAFPANPLKTVKAALDISMDMNGQMENDIISGSRNDKFTVGIVYDVASVSESTKCLGKDYEYVTTDLVNFPSGKKCYVVLAKDFIIK